MSVQLLDGSGKGNRAKIDVDKRLWVDSRSAALQHEISYIDEEAFQVIGTATLASGTVIPLHITNDNQDKEVVITYIRHQIVDQASGTAFPNASCYFAIRYGTDYSSGGATATPVNMHIGSSKVAGVTCYQTNPTLSGTAVEIDRWYTKAESDMNTFNKEGALILKPGQSLDLAYIGDHTSGIIYSRVSFILRKLPKNL